MAINCNRKVFVGSYCHRIRAIIGWLEGFANRIVTDKHMSGFCKSIRNVGGPLRGSR